MPAPSLPAQADDAAGELAAWLRLTGTPGVGDASIRRLLAAFGLPSQVLRQSPAALRQVVGAAQVQALQAEPPGWQAQWALTQQWLAGEGQRRVMTLADADYPRELLETPDPPPLLYLHGDVGLLSHPQRLAVVGSRNTTPQGALNARDMAAALAASGACIVSGLALGVDGAAHEGALSVGGATVAVVGTGLDRVYPRQHLDLARRMARHGLVVSEFALGTGPHASHFPKRNRIIAGLCQGTLVVEAALASGSLITAKLAADMGREVFAIPGSIHAPQARGCHALIRQGAKLVESAQDVLEDLRGAAFNPPLDAPLRQAPQQAALIEAPEAGLSADHLGVLKALGHEVQGFDALQARTGWPTPWLQAALLELELDGHLARLPGGAFQRLVRA